MHGLVFCAAAFTAWSSQAPHHRTLPNVHNAATQQQIRMDIRPLDSQSFPGAMDFPGLTIVKFYAPWCRACRGVAAAYQSCARTTTEGLESVQFCEVNFKDNKALCLKERVYQLPAIHFYTKDFGRVNRFILTPASAPRRLREEIDRFLGADGHLSHLQDLQSTALDPMVRYVELMNVMNAIANAPKYAEDAQGASALILQATGSPERRAALERLFDRLDTDHNGVLDADELGAVARALGRADEGADEARVDDLPAESLDREAFVRLMTSKAAADFDKPDAELLPAFEALDVDGDGVLTREEVLEAMARLQGAGDACADAMQAFDALDVDQSGTLDYGEFVAMMSGTHPTEVQ